MTTLHRIVHGDARFMAELDDGSIDLVVTSPPYWQLKDYGSPDEIGFHDSYETYINHLNLVWQEVARVLDKGGRLCVNIGDQFARSVYYGRYKVIPIRTEIVRCCEALGLDYMGAIIWQKKTTTNTSGGATIMGSFPFPKNGILKLDYEFILVFKKPGKTGKKIDPVLKERSRMSKKEWNTFFSGHWNFPGAKQNRHLAMFPVELPRRLIKMFTFVGDTVLDPFLGSGTTSLAALELNRNSVGYEINGDFIPVISDRFAQRDGDRSSPGEYRLEKQTNRPADFRERLAGLPYIFRDPVQLDRKVDPHSMPFGSKTRRKSRTPLTYHGVKEILSPTRLVLKNGQKIGLLGIKELPRKADAAIAFLRQKIAGGRVFYKCEGEETGDDGFLPCYLYLKNRTFLNAHLVKQNLVAVDVDLDFKHKKRFLEYRRRALDGENDPSLSRVENS